MQPNEWLSRSYSDLLEELKEFLRFSSVSAQPQYKSELYATAQWLKGYLEKLGFVVQLIGEPPVVHGYYESSGEAPTVLFYGHYDVQPPEPLELWVSPPFSPRIADDSIYARGACDDKGQVFIHLAAWKYFVEAYGKLPVSIHVVIEGQEETGSETLYQVLAAHGMQWRSDVVVVSDTGFFSEDIPTLTIGLRGIVYGEIVVQGPSRDLHSGSFGGVAPNPAFGLSSILAALKGPDQRVCIPGFYERVRPISSAERQLWRSLPADEAHYIRLMGAPAVVGEVGFSPLERIGSRPSLDINGMYSGYTGEGSKTIIPAQAVAKVSMRLVPDQDPTEIWQLFKSYVESVTPPGFSVEVRLLHDPAPAFETPTESPYYQAAEKAIQEAFGKRPVPIREGGSIPVLSALQKSIGGAPVILMGFGLPTDAVHSPNEHFRLSQLRKGIHAAIRFYEQAALVRSSSAF
ncbi:MAG: dipeptidase [Bacteroidia bacterium]|nr:dipeptidase [Bacteroidia bacterium]MDW8417102.1 dipeptidase [Bacteroidia bacterium]